MVTYSDGLCVYRHLPIQVVTGPSVEQLCWSRPVCEPLHQAASLLPLYCKFCCQWCQWNNFETC